MDPNENQPDIPNPASDATVGPKPPVPCQWEWITQRQQTDTDAVSVWKLGFIAPDGGEVRVTFHQVGESAAEKQQEQPPVDPNQQQPPVDPTQDPTAAPAAADGQQAPPVDPTAAPSDKEDSGSDTNSTKEDAKIAKSVDPSVLKSVNDSLGQQQGLAAPGAGIDPSMGTDPMAMQGPPPVVPIKGEPNLDQTTDSTFYVTFFANRHPESFMLWDTSLPHEQSLIVWVTITHGVVDFIRKAKPANVILDDLSNGKLKMVLRSVAMDAVAANPEYQIEQTQKHHYRSYFQIKRNGAPSAFANDVSGTSVEGDTQPLPLPGNQDTSGIEQKPVPQQLDPATKQGSDQQPFPTSDPVAVQQTPPESSVPSKKGLSLEVGRDFSVAIKDKDGNAVDRYQANSPADLLRWINSKGYGANHMKIVSEEQPSGVTESMYTSKGNIVEMHKVVSPKQAALMNYIVNANSVRATKKSLCFEFTTDKDMDFKRALVELAFQKTQV